MINARLTPPSAIEEEVSGVEQRATEGHRILRISNDRVTILTPILFSTALSVIGQLTLKTGMSQIGPVALGIDRFLPLIWAIATSPLIIVGMAIYTISFFFWLIGLSRAPLSYAYPFVSLSYLAILAASHFALGEPVSALRLVGVCLICVGVLAVAAT